MCGKDGWNIGFLLHFGAFRKQIGRYVMDKSHYLLGGLGLSEVRWAMVGCGAVTVRKSAPAFQQVPGSKLVAVAARNVENATEFASKNAIPHVFADPEEMIRSADVDAIYVATPPSSHKHYGKPCCVEKPMAVSSAEAREMVAAFAAANLPLFVSYYRRSLPRFDQVKSWIDQGEIGDIRHAHWTLVRPPTRSDLNGTSGWRTSAKEAPGGYFDDLACHGLDLLDHLLGPIEKSCGMAANQQQLYDAPDAIVASWQHRNKATGTGAWNFAGHRREDRVAIHGSKGVIRFSIFDEAPLMLETAAKSIEVAIENPDPIQYHHVERMIAHLRGKASHPSTGVTALRTASVMDRIIRG
jgi:1,5-anhydro-D-fructose reductase (1,5-anhydro-D-mannitol-forming)